MASLDDIEGIGTRYANKLRSTGTRSVEALLDNGATKRGRAELAKATGFAEKTILEWVNRADLMRVKGISTQYSDLLEAAGVDSVKELAQRNARSLADALRAANEKGRKRLVRRVPGEGVVKKWIDQAKKLPKVVKH